MEKNKIKILIVDDEECIRDFLSYMLDKGGFLTENACNGKEALEKVAQNKPDIIILDITMPVMDGLETCRRLREHPDNLNIPIIFMSATEYDYITQTIRGMPGGAIRYIEKPCELKYLFSQINSLVFWSKT